MHVDEANKRIVMYFHGEGVSKNYPGCNQLSYVSISKDGLNFNAFSYPVAPFYLRMFKVNDKFYGIAKNRNKNGLLLVSSDWLKPFKILREVFPRIRHSAIFVDVKHILMFYSRIGDKPESIMLSRIPLEKFPKFFCINQVELVAKPEMEYEGVDIRANHSFPGKSRTRSQEVRDPAIFSEDGRLYLLYSNAGEAGICISEYHDKENEVINSTLLNEYYTRAISSRLYRQIIYKLKSMITS